MNRASWTIHVRIALEAGNRLIQEQERKQRRKEKVEERLLLSTTWKLS